MSLQELYAKKEELRTSGLAAAKAGNKDEADKIKAEMNELEEEIKAEIMFSEDERQRETKAQAFKLSNINAGTFGQGMQSFDDTKKSKDFDEQKKNDPLASAEYFAAFVDTLQGNASRDQKRLLGEVNAQNTGNTGILVPNSVVGGIWTMVDELYPLWRAIPKTRVNGSITIQRNVGSDDVLGWVEENQQTRMTRFHFENFDLNGHEISLGIDVSFKLNAMSRNDFVSHIQQQLAVKFGYQLARAVYEGTGVGMGFGIKTRLLQGTNTERIIQTPKITYHDLTQWFAKIKSGILHGCTIYANNYTIWTELADMVDNNGRPILFQAVSNGSVGNIFGVSVVESGELADGEVLIANMTRGMRCNINKDITIAHESDNRNRRNSYFLHSIVDFDVFDIECFALITSTP